jgi:hypothetical protein
MTFHEYLAKTRQHDAQRAGERDRLLQRPGETTQRAVTAPVPPTGHGAWPG